VSYLLLARCGFDLNAYFIPEDFACIRDFNTRDTVLTLGNTVSESASLILRQVEYAVKRHMFGKAPGSRTPVHPPEQKPSPENAAAGEEKPAAAPFARPNPEIPPTAASEPPQDASPRPGIQSILRAVKARS